MRLLHRRAVITVDTLKVTCDRTGFDCEFDVQKDLTGKPNKATVSIYGLNDEHRGQLEERAAKGRVRVTLEAGYEEGTSQIFAGDVRILRSSRKHDTWITMIETGDGDRLIGTSRVLRSWNKGTSVEQVIRDIVQAIGVGEGNLRQVAASAELIGYGPGYTLGTVVTGRAFQELERIARSCGIEWSVQDGVMQFLVKDKALAGTAVLLTPQTGLEGSPSFDHKGNLHVDSRIIPNLFPGRKVQLADKTTWRVEKAHYQGQTKGQHWTIHMQCKKAT